MRTTSILCAALLAPFAAAQNITASLEAVTPIVASWVSAPPGTVGATVTHPAGPLTSASIASTYGIARFSCDLSFDGIEWKLDASSSVFSLGFGDEAFAEADLLLTLAAPAGTVAALSLEFSHQSDTSVPNGFLVDVGNDGTFEHNIGPGLGVKKFREVTLVFGANNIEVRIKGDNPAAFPPTTLALQAKVREWSPHASPVAEGCDSVAQYGYSAQYLMLDSDYSLDAVTPDAPNALAKLRARGLGQFAWFCASTSHTSMTFQLPSPILGSCPLLADILITSPGTITASGGMSGLSDAYAWVLAVPLLPPGFTFYMQHASASLMWSFGSPRFGTSNILRIDT